MSFTPNEWASIDNALERHPERYGMPEGGREKSLVLGSFNIRKLGSARRRKRELDFMGRFCAACDLVAIQEVQDDLEGLRYLKQRTEARVAGAGEYALAISDITGEAPGESGMAERLAFLYRHRRIRRLELASDLTFDRTAVLSRFFDHEKAWLDAHAEYETKFASYRKGVRQSKPAFVAPAFLTFLRTPYVVAFEAPAANDAEPLTFTAVNAHLIYGAMREREQEFDALITWIASRLLTGERLVAPNFVLMGDLNLNFDRPRKDRARIDARIRHLNERLFGSADVRRIYFPFLDPHPRHARVLRTNACASQTFDQFGFFNGKDEARLPNDRWLQRIPKARTASRPDDFDFGVFDFAELFSRALNGKAYLQLDKSAKKALARKFEHTVSDHLPIWVRLPRLGFSP